MPLETNCLSISFSAESLERTTSCDKSMIDSKLSLIAFLIAVFAPPAKPLFSVSFVIVTGNG